MSISTITGVVNTAKKVCGHKVKVNPIGRHYEEEGEPEYVKWHCPVCYIIGNQKMSIPHGSDHCPACGVRLNWDRQPELNDKVYILEKRKIDIIHPVNNAAVVNTGTIIAIEEPTEENDEKLYWIRIKRPNKKPKTICCDASEFSIIEGEG